MAMAGDIKAGGAFIEIGTDDAKMRKGLASAEKRLEGFGRKMGQIGRGLAIAGAAVTAPLVIGLKKFAALETKIAKISTLLRGEDVQLLPGFETGIDELAKKTGVSAGELADGLFSIISASIPANEAMKTLGVAAEFARGGFADAGVATSAMVNVLNAYGLSADKARSVTDFLAEAARSGQTDVSLLAPAIGRVATFAEQSGLSLEELGAALSTITRKGINTNEAVSGLKAVLAELTTGTGDSAKIAKSWGIEMTSSWLKANGLGKALDILNTKTFDQVKTVIKSREALTGLGPLLRDTAGFHRDVAEQTDRDGAAQRNYAIAMATLTARYEQTKEQADSFFRALGAHLAGPATQFLEWLMEAIGGVTAFIKENEELVRVIAIVGFGLLALGAGFIGLAVAAKLAGIALAGMKLVGAVAGLLGVKAGAIGAAAAMGLLSKAVIAVGVWMAGWELGKWLAELSGLDKMIESLATKWNLFGGKENRAIIARENAKMRRILAQRKLNQDARAEATGVSEAERQRRIAQASAARQKKAAAKKAMAKADAPGGITSAADIRAMIEKALLTVGIPVAAAAAAATGGPAGTVGGRLPVKLGLSDFETQTRGSFSARGLSGVRPMEGIAIRQLDLLKLIADASTKTAANTGKPNTAVFA